MEKRDLGSPDTVTIQVGTNHLRRTVSLDYMMGNVHAHLNKAKATFPQSRLVLSGVLRRRDVSWRRIEAVNDRYDWIAKIMGVASVHPKSWIEDWDSGRDGLHMHRRAARQLSHVYSRVCGFCGGGQKLNQ
jgi:hypothetical protein